MMTTATTNDLTYTTSDYRGEETVERIMVIEYHRGRPHSVVTDRSCFDFDYCRRDDVLYFRDVGGSCGAEDPDYSISAFCEPVPPPGKIWIAPGVRLHRWESTEKPEVPVDDAMLLAMGYVRLDEPLALKTYDGTTRNPFEAGEETDCHIEYCGICKDNFPADHLCGHIYLPSDSDAIGSGRGKPTQESFFLALDWLAEVKGWEEWPFWRWENTGGIRDAVHMVERQLMSTSFARMQACSTGIEDTFAGSMGYIHWQKQFDDCEDGLGWLTTLGPDTPEANAETLRWIMEWRLSARERAVARERQRLIKALESRATTPEAARAILTALGVPGAKRKEELEAVPLERLREVAARFAEVAAVEGEEGDA